MPWVTKTIHDIYQVVLRGQPSSFPTTGIFLGLGTDASAPNLSGGGFTEVTAAQLGGTTYQRQPITLSNPAARGVNNTVACLFTNSANPPAPFNIRYGGIFSTQTITSPVTDATLLAYGNLATILFVTVGSLVNIPAGQLTITDQGLA